DLEGGAAVLTNELRHVVDDAVGDVHGRCGIDLAELVFAVVAADTRDVDRTRRLHRVCVFTDVRPAEVLQVAAVVEVHAVDAVVAENRVAQRRAVFHAEGRILALFLAAVAERAARIEGLAAAVIGAARYANRRRDRLAARGR